jgi:TolB protein
LAFYGRRGGYDHNWTLGDELRQVTNSPFDNYDSDEVFRVQWSPDGRSLAYVSDRNDDLYNSDIYVDERCLTTPKDSFDWAPRWSPDGKRIAYVSDIDGWARIWIMNADGTDPKALTSGDFEDDLPAWSPDGAKICFARNRDGKIDLMVTSLDGKAQRVTKSDGHWTLVSWVGDRLAATLSSPSCPGDLFIVGDEETYLHVVMPLRIPS